MFKIFLKSIVVKSALYMILSGIIMGIVFLPISIYLLGIDAERVYSFTYISICLVSGIFVGLMSFLVVRISIISAINRLSNKINDIAENILDYQKGNIENINGCKDCYVNLESNDVLGKIAKRYNSLLYIIRSLFWRHDQTDKFFSILNRSLKIDDLDKNTVDFICSVTGAIAAEIYHLNKNDELKIGYAKGVHISLSNSKIQSLKDIIEEGRLISLRDYKVEVIEFGTGTIKPTEVIYFPIQYSNMGIGLFVLYFDTYISKEKRDLIKYILLNNYSLAYQNALSYEKIQDIAAFDELTGLYNRRFGMKRLQEEYERTKRSNNCLCLIMFDIDHFKNVNDTYGHQAGDYILSSFAKILKDNFRIEDVIMRYGGEEFLCTLNNTDIEPACQKIEDVRKKVSETTFNFRNIEIKITISAGISSFSEQNRSETIEELIKKADERLYRAKNSGRNYVCAI